MTNSLGTSAFSLPDARSAKADPALVAADDQHLTAIAVALREAVTDLTRRLAEERRAPVRMGSEVLARDQEVQRLSTRLRTLGRYGMDLCLGRMVAEDGEVTYVGRLGLTGADGSRLLVDWRSPAAEPFFGATHAHPMGLVSRRRYRWNRERVTDYWDEVFTAEGLTSTAALDDQSAFVASLGSSRSPRMRDVLGTIQADQDAIIRAGSRGALVVDGGPGTGKTVVALHRTAYLLYSDPRLGHRRGGVLFVGPHEPYLAYVSDVLPSLGEEGVQTCTVRDLVPEGATAPAEADPRVARLKSTVAAVAAVERGVRFYEDAPDERTRVSTPYGDVVFRPDDWTTAFDAPSPGTPHNEARDEVLDELVSIAVDQLTDAAEDEDEGEVSADEVATSLRSNRELLAVLNGAWPLIEPEDLVADLWTVPAYLRLCAPSLSREEVRALQREDGRAWTLEDLPVLDAARRRLGDPDASRRRRREAAADKAEREEMARVVEHLIEDDDSEMSIMKMLRVDDMQEKLAGAAGGTMVDPDLLAGPFAHVVVDEAQELTDAQWQMLLLRCPSRSFTIVGDRAQARHGFGESWEERLTRIGLSRVEIASLTVNYRTPAQVMAEAEPVIRAVLPDANVPTSIREGDHPVVHGPASDLASVVEDWLAAHTEGTACVIGDPTYVPPERVQSLTPVTAKGLEFDLVVLVDPEDFGDGMEGGVDRYVAMTRATQQLVVLTSG